MFDTIIKSCGSHRPVHRIDVPDVPPIKVSIGMDRHVDSVFGACDEAVMWAVRNPTGTG